MEDSMIFTGPDPVLQKRYKKAILIGRIVVFIYSIFSIGLVALAVIFSSDEGLDQDSRMVVWVFGILGAIFTAAALLSKKRPFAFLLTSAIVAGLVWLLLCLGFFAADKTYDSILVWSIVLVVLATILLVIRGTVFASKYNALIKGAMLYPEG